MKLNITMSVTRQSEAITLAEELQETGCFAQVHTFFLASPLQDSTSLFHGEKSWYLVHMAVSQWPGMVQRGRTGRNKHDAPFISVLERSCLEKKMLDFFFCILGSSFPSPPVPGSVLCARWLHFMTEFIKCLRKQGKGRRWG